MRGAPSLQELFGISDVMEFKERQSNALGDALTQNYRYYEDERLREEERRRRKFAKERQIQGALVGGGLGAIFAPALGLAASPAMGAMTGAKMGSQVGQDDLVGAATTGISAYLGGQQRAQQQAAQQQALELDAEETLFDRAAKAADVYYKLGRDLPGYSQGVKLPDQAQLPAQGGQLPGQAQLSAQGGQLPAQGIPQSGVTDDINLAPKDKKKLLMTKHIKKAQLQAAKEVKAAGAVKTLKNYFENIEPTLPTTTGIPIAGQAKQSFLAAMGKNDAVQAYNNQKKSMANLVARNLLGEVGTMTDQDREMATTLLAIPGGDTPGVRELKNKYLKELMEKTGSGKLDEANGRQWLYSAGSKIQQQIQQDEKSKQKIEGFEEAVGSDAMGLR